MVYISRPYQASLFGILKADLDEITAMKATISGHSRSLASNSDSVRREKLFLHEPADLGSLSSKRALWVQRRNSLSSQSAIYPPTLRYASTSPLSLHASFQLNRSMPSFPTSVPYTPSYRSARKFSMTPPSPFSFGNFYTSLPPSQAGSIVSTVSRSTSSTSSRKSPLSTMRRASEPEVPIIPAKFLDAHSRPSLQRSPTLPCSWSPALIHAPLSADPLIRAFSSESEAPHERPVMRGNGVEEISSVNGFHYVGPSVNRHTSQQSPLICLELPVRARGHSIPSDTVSAGSSSANALVPAARYSTRPPVSNMASHQ